MHPSGRWQGYWEQVGWGRQPMEDLVLHFRDGTVEGEGRDVIGDFTFSGRCDRHGNFVMVKEYDGRHTVLYQGTYDGEGTLFGRWSIGDAWSGPFALRAERSSPTPDAPIQEL